MNPEIRAGISAFALADASVVEKGVRQLKEDLDSGRWDAKYGGIREVEEIDAGYRLSLNRKKTPTITVSDSEMFSGG